MDFKEFSTGKNDISRRVDKVIRLFAPQLSLPEIYKGIRKGLIKINNHKTKSEYRILENDVISIAAFLLNKENNNIKDDARGSTALPLPKMPEIIFENSNILIINKPYNVNVHGDSNSLDKVIEKYYNEKPHEQSLSFKPGPLHRLDKKTTGLLAFSKSLEGAHWFSENIQNHKIQKKYYGLAQGILEKAQTWEDTISKIEDKTNKFHTVDVKETGNDKTAVTMASPIAYGKLNNKKVTLVEYTIKTGRKHQIRAQSSLHKHPLLGDTAYGGEKIENSSQDFYLTARELIIPKDNPLGLPEKLKAKLPKSFINILKDCGIEKSGV